MQETMKKYFKLLSMLKPYPKWHPPVFSGAIFLLFFFHFSFFTSHAGNISMLPKINMKVGNDWTEVSVRISNRGDEDSLVVFPTLRLGDAELSLKQAPYVAFGGSRQWKHRFLQKDLGLTHKGAYPLFLMITYHDANMYPYSMPEVTRFNYGPKIYKTRLGGSLVVSDIKAKGTATLTLKNPLPHPISGKYTLFAPKELAPENREEDTFFITSLFSLQAGEHQKFKIQIHNRGALRGSSYKIFCVAEFAESDIHHTLVISSIAKVTETMVKNQATSQIIGGSVFIALLFLITAYLEIRKAGKNT